MTKENKVKKNKLDNLVPIKPTYGEAMANKPVCVMLPVDLDAYVRSLPNRAEWLREAAMEKWHREQSAESDSEN